MRLHTGEKPYACNICEYRCAIKGNLRMHVRLNHSLESQMQCPQCAFVATSKKVLKEHLREHSAKPLKCEHCSYTTNSRSALNNHNRIHTNEKPYDCVICGYACRQACNLRTHMRKKHPDHEVGFVRKKKDQNQLKEARASAKAKLKAGRAYCQTLYPCHLCDCSFVREDSLRSHIRHHQDIAPQAGAALAILQLQQSQSSLNNVDEEVHFADFNEVESGQFAMITTDKIVTSEQGTQDLIATQSSQGNLLLQRLSDQGDTSQNEMNSQLVINSNAKFRGNGQKKEAETLKLLANANGQLFYQLPAGMRILPLSIDNQSTSTVFLLNEQQLEAELSELPSEK